ncbi:periplasmic binding protein-like II [Anaeromyces robustus]|uniref:Periplasmic binding protein-like II n=1 Tax=Anaeromyces robustus TaxID=1754192 RepID=A0A1Y1WQ98_9FUNG|nr:periplasmic binding protein-like II [Anaeromyces robustus]|eukprot:ORX75703.1 periplasmic binding protein-like II [Anaeromyces robustus]
MIIFNILFLVFFLLKIENSISVKINAIAYAFNENRHIYGLLINDFNQYAIDTGLDVQVSLNLLTPANSTTEVNDISATYESVLSKKSEKYDLYFYDSIYTSKFNEYFIDLNKYFSKEYLTRFDQKLLKNTCIINKKLVGLPVSLDYAGLYSNRRLLNEYNKSIPTTWNELLETALYIKEKEESKGHKNIVYYHGLVPDSETGSCSLIEFIHSFRKSKKSPYPEARSQETGDALTMIKKLKDELSSDMEFLSGDDYFFQKIFTDNALFLKFWYIPGINPAYNITILPGNVEGVSGTVIGGNNMAISTFSTEEKQLASFKVMEYLTSYDIQKKNIKENDLISPIPELYNDENLCKEVDCEFIKSFQPINRPSYDVISYDKYSQRFRTSANSYIYGNASLPEVLRNIDDISRVYYFSISTEESYLGLILFIVFCIILIIMIGSYSFLFMEKFKSHFQSTPYEFWFLIISGSIVLLFRALTEYGKISYFICQSKPFLLSVGVTMTLCPVLHRLIVNFPVVNEISEWTKNNKWRFMLIFFTTDIVFLLLSMIQPFKHDQRIDKYGRNYKVCANQGSFLPIVVNSMLGIKYLTIFVMVVLLFLEWNLKETYNDMSYMMSTIAIDIILIISLFVVDNITNNNYIYYFGVYFCIFALSAVTNFIFLYGIKIIYILLNPKKMRNDENMSDEKGCKENASNNNDLTTLQSAKI